MEPKMVETLNGNQAEDVMEFLMNNPGVNLVEEHTQVTSEDVMDILFSPTVDMTVQDILDTIGEQRADTHASLEQQTKVKKVCGKCGGRGHLNQYAHVNNGICFKCGGSGYL